MPSKQVVDRQKSATAVGAAADTHGPKVAAAVSEVVASYLQEGEVMPDVALLLVLAKRLLDDRTASMVAADEAHAAELGDDAPARDAREETSHALRDLLVTARPLLAGVYGPGAPAAVGLVGSLPDDPAMLARKAGEVATALGAADLGEPRSSYVSLDPTALADDLAIGAAAVDAALKKVAAEVREAETTLTAKHGAIDGYDGAFADVAWALNGVFRLGGERELAERIRPSVRRPGRTVADAEEHEVPIDGDA